MKSIPSQEETQINEVRKNHPHSSDTVHNVLFDLFLTGSISPLLKPEIGFQGKPWITCISNTELDESANFIQVTDIPEYLDVEPSPEGVRWKVKVIPQYKGYASDLRGMNSAEDYVKEKFSSKHRSALRSKIRRLEADCDIRYDFFCGAISDEDYLRHMDAFYNILRARFDQKRMFNKNLLYWPEYFRIFKPLIRRGEACLLVMQNGEQPISYSIGFCRNKVMFGFIQSFDPEYSRYNLGDVTMYRKLERAIELGMQWYDFSKGENDFKKKWCNRSYRMHYWVCYTHGSITSRVKAGISIRLLRLRQWLRDIGFLGKRFQFDRFFYNRLAKKLDGHDWRSELSDPPR